MPNITTRHERKTDGTYTSDPQGMAQVKAEMNRQRIAGAYRQLMQRRIERETEREAA